MALKFAFLVLREHPYGREMLRILLENGFQPGLIVDEVSAVEEEERQKFLTRIAGQPIPPTCSDLIAGLEIPREEVDSHNSAACRELLESFDPELVVLGGTGIIQPHILEVPARGTVNAHPGLLPRLRGSSSVAWALYRDLPVGSTVHYVNAGIDTGAVILRRALPVHRGDTYEQIVRRVLTLSGELMAETLEMLQEREVQGVPQDRGVGETLRVIPPEFLKEAKIRLIEGRYSHFVD